VKEFSLEVRVGLLVVVGLAAMGALLFQLAGLHLEKGYAVYVDFNNPGGVKSGAPVRIAGVRVGTVEHSEYRGGTLDPETGRRALVRIQLKVDRDVEDTIHDDAHFYVTSQGVLGEPFVAIDPGSPGRPLLQEGTVVQGIDPPRLDLALAMGYELLEIVVSALRHDPDEFRNALHNAGGTLKGMNELLGENHERINGILANLEESTAQSVTLLQQMRENYVDGPQPRRMLQNLDQVLSVASQEGAPLLRDVRGALAEAREVLGPEQRADIKSAIRSAAAVASKANLTLGDAQQIMAHTKRGQGTLGALLMEEAAYDDVQELLRDLRRNPWKLIWRE